MRAGMLEAVDHLEVACSAWRRQDPECDARPVGGTIVAIENVLDESTGEIKRRFAILRRDAANRLRKVWLEADELDVESMGRPNPVAVRDLWRTLSREVALRKGTPTPDEGDCLRMAVQLYEAVAIR